MSKETSVEFILCNDKVCEGSRVAELLNDAIEIVGDMTKYLDETIVDAELLLKVKAFLSKTRPEDV